MSRSKIQFIPNKIVGESNIRSGKPVTSSQWRSIARLANHVRSIGGTIVPCQCFIDGTGGEGGGPSIRLNTSKTFRYWVYPRQISRTRLWVFRFSATDIGAGGLHSLHQFKGTVNVNGTGAVPFNSNGTHNNSVVSLQHGSTDSDSGDPQEYYVTIANTGTAAPYGPVIVEQISCFEMPRYHVLPTEPEGSLGNADISSCKKGALIRHKSGYSVRGCFETAAAAKTSARRNIMCYSNPYAITMTNSTYALVMTKTNVEPEALGRYLTSATINENLRCNVYAKVSSGTAHFRVTPSYTGASSYVMTFTNTATAWYSSTAGMLITTRAEDLTASDGRRNSVWSTLLFEAKCDTATSFDIYHISVGEHSGD